MGTLQQIAKHEAAHVEFLRAQIIALGGAPVTYTGAEFDFTGGNGGAMRGPFSEARTDLAMLLALAQVLEDVGVRAYKGQLATLMGSPAVLTAALKIHSVEGRHSARIRILRNVAGLKPWISSTATVNTTGITVTGAGTAPGATLYVIPSGFARTAGSFATDRFVTGMVITSAGFTNAANNGTATITAVSIPDTGTTSLSATATGYARASGSFITNGFVVGQQITASGFTNAANNGRSTITAVTATALTVTKDTPTVVEAAATGRRLLGDSRVAVSRPTGSPALVPEASGAGRFLVTPTGITTSGFNMITNAYAGETNSSHAGVDASGLGNNTGGVTGVNEAFDEPLTYAQVIAIIQDFVIGTTP
jgi:hypothetical protein